MGKAILLILVLIILYFIINYILTKINNYYSKKYIPFDINSKNLKGFEKWRNKAILITLIVIVLIYIIILLFSFLINKQFIFHP